MTEVERGNLRGEPSIEYAVHGKFRRHEDDLNGIHGCWYIPLTELLMTFGADILQPKLVAFEVQQARLRVAAFTAFTAAQVAAPEEDEDAEE